MIFVLLICLIICQGAKAYTDADVYRVTDAGVYRVTDAGVYAATTAGFSALM